MQRAVPRRCSRAAGPGLDGDGDHTEVTGVTSLHANPCSVDVTEQMEVAMTTQTTNSLRSAQPAQLSDDELEIVAGGAPKLDMTNNLQTTAQKAAEKADAYIRS
jgi:hypothetical protein